MPSSAKISSETPQAAHRTAPLVALFHFDTARVERLVPPAAGLPP